MRKTSTPEIECARGAVIILGAPRSGTTMLAGLLGKLGLFLGGAGRKDLEARYFTRANNAMLRRTHGHWDNPEPLCYALRDGLVVEEYARCLKRDLESPRLAGYMGWGAYLRTRSLSRMTSPWGWKDPRTLFTLEVWLRVFPRARLVYIVRNGVDVAASLRIMASRVIAGRRARMARRRISIGRRSALERRGFRGAARCLHLDGAFSLWEEYAAQARRVLSTGAAPVHELRYEDFLSRPREHLEKLVRFCELAHPGDRAIEELASTVQADRAFAFLGSPELVDLYEQVRSTTWMQAWGYDTLEVLDEA